MYQRNTHGWTKHLDFMMLDLVSLQISFVLTCMARNGFKNPYENSTYVNLLLTMTLISALLSVVLDTYKNVLKRGPYAELLKTLKQVSLVFLLITLYLFTIKSGDDISRVVLYLTIFCYFCVSYGSRILWKGFLKKRKIGAGASALLIVTTKELAADILENFQKNSLNSFLIRGVVLIKNENEEESLPEEIQNLPAGIRVLSYGENTARMLCREWIDEAFICIPTELRYPEKLINQFMEMGIVVHFCVSDSSMPMARKQFLERVGSYTVLTTGINYAGAGQLFVKRVLDIVLGVVGCLITGLLTLVLGPLIYIKSPGPIFFSQVRIGRNGKKFRMYKFRSMYLDAEERKEELLKENRMADGMMFKLDFDPRIIGSKMLPDGTVKKGIGNFIRDWSLDEFPQFFNVLKGDMSMVGTRPPTVDEWEKYDLHHRVRLAVKPGITGLWQVSGRSNITDFDEVVKLDTRYITEWNVAMDVKIFLKTVLVVFRKDGAM